MEKLRLWAYVISWTGVEESAKQIAAALEKCVDRLAVVYSNAEEKPTTGPGEWIQVPNSHYYAEKFQASIAHFDGDIMLHINADARCDDWASLVHRCLQVFTDHSTVGIWSPLTHWAGLMPDQWELPAWSNRIHIQDPTLREVVFADNVVWALRGDICNRFRGQDLSIDHFGWGTVSAANAIAYAKGFDIVVDESMLVHHRLGSGYNTKIAEAGKVELALSFLEEDEKRVFTLHEAVLDRGWQLDSKEYERALIEQQLAALRHRLRHLRAVRDGIRRAVHKASSSLARGGPQHEGD